jgi:predicted extracellular nuclease
VKDSIQTVTNPDDQQTNPENPFFETRLPLVATFTFGEDDDDKAYITIINNHFSSKGGSSPLFGLIQPSVRLQEDPSVNGQVDIRRSQAQSVLDFIDTLDGRLKTNVIALGDFNEFEFISPIEKILGQRLTNLTETLPEKERYTFIFQGNSQSLDHILISDNLLEDARFDIVHVNSEFAETPQRASDHDPLIVRLEVEEEDDDDDDGDDDDDDD